MNTENEVITRLVAELRDAMYVFQCPFYYAVVPFVPHV